MTDSKPGKPADKAAGKPVEAASAAPGEKRSASRPPLARASESGDPAVHQALAELQTAQMNAAAHEASGDQYAGLKSDHDDQVAKARAALAELGFE